MNAHSSERCVGAEPRVVGLWPTFSKVLPAVSGLRRGFAVDLGDSSIKGFS